MSLIKIIIRLGNLKLKTRGFFVKLYLIGLGCRIGRNFVVGSGCRFNIHAGGRIEIGDNFFIGDGAKFEVMPGATIKIGSNVKMTGSNWIVAVEKIEIGDSCLFGEFSALRDHQHGIKSGVLISRQPLTSNKIFLGSDVWVGRSAVVLAGSCINSGAIVAAGAILKCDVGENEIYGGVPAKFIKKRV